MNGPDLSVSASQRLSGRLSSSDRHSAGQGCGASFDVSKASVLARERCLSVLDLRSREMLLPADGGLGRTPSTVSVFCVVRHDL